MTKSKAIETGKLKYTGQTGDGKRAFVEFQDGGRPEMENVRIEFDTDDADSKWVLKVMRHIIKVVNAAADDERHAAAVETEHNHPPT